MSGPAAGSTGTGHAYTDTAWEKRCAHAWGREPVHATGVTPPVDAAEAFGTAVRMSGPFRAGARPRSVSAVRFFTVDGRLAAPGALLPTEDDLDRDRYADRLDRELGGKGRLLTIRHPFVLNFARWARTRDALAGLWRRAGWPALPLTAELSFGHGCSASAPAPGTDVLTWVLGGTFGPGARAGDLLYRPAASAPDDAGEVYRDRAAVLRILVPTDPTTALPAVRTVLLDLVRRDPLADRAMPYLPYPPPENPDGSTPVSGEFAEVADVLRRVIDGPDAELERAVRRRWAARRSAAGLEPVPEPRPATDLGPGADSRVRLGAQVLRVPEGANREVWAVNGLLLPVRGTLAARVLAELDPERAIPVRDLLARVGAAGHPAREDGVLALLRALYRTRALEPVGPDESLDPDEPVDPDGPSAPKTETQP
ncbi:hypothetical protein ACFZBU_18220 [Embleya sp. NPDC008237]|uniref:hypothetical protein n=1 Tax=Embleya sp. NPDC008237 TaxID=3363978 RepID=UPI0036E58ABE